MLSDFGQHTGWSFLGEGPNMDVLPKSRERVFSILNNNDCPSFQHRQKNSSPSPPPNSITLPPISSITSPSFQSKFPPARPNLYRQPQFARDHSISSAGSPPLLRYDSTSSASSSKSNSSMEGTPSPITPAYSYNEAAIGPYDSVLRPDLTGNYLPSPTGITPFMDSALMLAPGPIPVSQDAFLPKTASMIPQPQPIAPAGFPIMPMVADRGQMPTPALSANASVSSTSSAGQQLQTSPAAANNANNTGKKNKYPCPYAASHNCSATFTTSGHAARHGKKHTGEKGVHCPVCDKAFTRKDNMKQHERTHKNHTKSGEDKKSKAQVTREAARAKEVQKAQDQVQQTQPASQPQTATGPNLAQTHPAYPAQIRKSSSGNSEPSDITLAPNPLDTPVDLSPGFFAETTPQIVMPGDSVMADPSIYPSLTEEALLSELQMPENKLLNLSIPQPPSLVRGFSDLDTLAQAAEASFIDPIDPYYPQSQF